MNTETDFYVVAYRGDKYYATISGLGCNRGTLDASHSKRAAQKHASRLAVSDKWKGFTFKVESQTQGECFGVYGMPLTPAEKQLGATLAEAKGA